MGIKTSISWCDSTLNLLMGCSAGCELTGGHCYAEALCNRMAGRKGFPKDFRKPEPFLERLDAALRWPDLTGKERPDKPWLNGLPRIVFLNDLGETFDPGVSVNWLAEPYAVGYLRVGEASRCVFEVSSLLFQFPDWTRKPSVLLQMGNSPHIYVILTKQAQRMAEFSQEHPFPPNVWVGVSVTNQWTADERIPWLLKTRAEKRIVSAEPLLRPITLWADWISIPCSLCGRHDEYCDCEVRGQYRTGRLRFVATPLELGPLPPLIDWVIVGGESGPHHRHCEVEWIESLVSQARAASVPVFVKQASGRFPGQQGRIPDEVWKMKEMPR